MFLRIVSQVKFWRSVMALSLGFALVVVLIKGVLTQGDFMSFLKSWKNLTGLILGALIYGFFAVYGRFYKHYKSQRRS